MTLSGKSEPAIAFDQVTKFYGRRVLALDTVTWAIQPGARACLLGPNGAGKSTAIRLLQGALHPTAGIVSLLGASAGDQSFAEARRRTGIVPQGPGMYRDLTTLEYLNLARRLYGRGDVDSIIEAFDLGDHRNKMLIQLSGGYQRRVSLATALLPEPDVLLLDEPTVGLDPVATHDVHTLLDRLMRGRTTLLCTHNLVEAEALCDEVIILRAGRVLLHEPLSALRRRATPHLRLAARQGVHPLLAALEGHGVTARSVDGAVLVPVTDPEAEAPDLLRHLLAAGLDVYECRPTQASLQDLFLDAVRSEP